MSTQDPSKFQGNRKSSKSKPVAPGDPLWTSGGDHDNVSYGMGYDHHDPVDFLRGEPLGGGYDSGQSAGNFGTIGFKEVEMTVQHGQQISILLERTGGTSGSADLTLEVDRNPLGSGVDPNTAILGDGNTRVVDGFDVCEVDLDLVTPNVDNPGVFWNDVTQLGNITFPANTRSMRLPINVPYRTQIGKLEPSRVYAPYTYLINEYQCYDAVATGWPPSKWITEHAACAPAGINGMLTSHTDNKSVLIELYAVQTPQKYTQGVGGPAPIEAFSYLLSRADFTDIKYRVAKTYTAESQAVIQSAPWNDPLRTDINQSCVGPRDEIHLTSVYNLTGGLTDPIPYDVNIGGTTVEFSLTTTPVSLSAALNDPPLGHEIRTSDGGPIDDPTLIVTPICSLPVQIVYKGAPGVNVSDPVITPSISEDPSAPLNITVLQQGDPGTSGSNFCKCLDALSAAAGGPRTYGTSHVVTQSGEYGELLKSTWSESTSSVSHEHHTVSAPIPATMNASGYESFELDVGQDPNGVSVLPDLDVSDPTATPPYIGLSDFRWAKAEDHVYDNMNLTPGSEEYEYGGTQEVLFTGRGMTDSSRPTDLIYNMQYTNPLQVPGVHNFPQGGSVPTFNLSGNPLTGAGYFWQANSEKKSVNQGKSMVSSWVVNDPISPFKLYDITAFDTSADDYNKNRDNLKGYYMTCSDHQTRVIYLKLGTKNPDTPYTLGNTRLKITVIKDDPYSVVQHASYSDQADKSLLMYHASGKSYADGDIIGKPTGGSLFDRVFTTADMVWDPTWVGEPGEFTAPASTGTVNVTAGTIEVTGRYFPQGPGPLSSDQMMFVSLMEGFKASNAFSETGFNPFKNPPKFTLDFVTPVQESVVGGGQWNKTVKYSNTGDQPLIVSFEAALDQLNPSDQQWSWDVDVAASTGTASAGTTQYTLDKDQHVTVDYKMIPDAASNMGDILTARHQLQVDYIGIDPGIFTYDVDFNIQIT